MSNWLKKKSLLELTNIFLWEIEEINKIRQLAYDGDIYIFELIFKIFYTYIKMK